MRSLRMTVCATFVTSPTSFAWNILAERLAPGHSPSAVVRKLCVQVTCMPGMIASQLGALSLLEGRSGAETMDKLKSEVPPTLAAGLCYWPVIGIFQYRFVDLINRPVFGSFAGIFWNTFLSHQANAPPLSVDEPAAPAVSGGEAVAAAPPPCRADDAAIARKKSLARRRTTVVSM
ncbi:unnamed protein product [Phaeothamnion confervicola]